MASISVKNDKFSLNLYKPLLKFSDKVFNSIINTIEEKFTDVFTSAAHWFVAVEHSQASRNIILISLKYDDTIKDGEGNVTTPATYIKKYVLNLNLITKELSVPSDNLVFGKPEFPYCDMLSKLPQVIGTQNNNIFTDDIDDYLETLQNISDSYKIKVISLSNDCGSCEPIELETDSDKVYDIDEFENLYAKNAKLTIEATANEHYKFVEWRNGGKSIKENPYTFTVTEHATYNAMFDKENYIVSLTANDPLAYSIFEGDGMYKYLDTVTLIAKPRDGYKFNGWFDDNNELLSKELTYKFNIENNMNITGKFTHSQHVEQGD